MNRTAVSLRDCMTEAGVHRDYLTPASEGAMRFLNRLLDNETASGVEWRRQRSAAFPHVNGEGTLAAFCLCCSDPWPCLSYYQDIDNGEVPA